MQAKDHQGFLVGQLFREITLDFSTDFLPVMKERLESRDTSFRSQLRAERAFRVGSSRSWECAVGWVEPRLVVGEGPSARCGGRILWGCGFPHPPIPSSSISSQSVAGLSQWFFALLEQRGAGRG